MAGEEGQRTGTPNRDAQDEMEDRRHGGPSTFAAAAFCLDDSGEEDVSGSATGKTVHPELSVLTSLNPDNDVTTTVLYPGYSVVRVNFFLLFMLM